MKIKEHHINAVLDLIDQDDFNMEEAMSNVDGALSNILSYSLSDNFALLTEEEKDYFDYLAITILIACLNNVPKIQDKDQDDIALIEETMWEKMENQKSKDFNKRLDTFFQATQEEDLMAFIEDGLTPEENDFVSPAGRELMFVGLATIVTALCD